MGRKKRKKQKLQQQLLQIKTPERPQQQTPMSTQVTEREMTQLQEVPGLMECVFKHTVSKTTAMFKWTGPKISPEVWNEVLAFFKWTNDTSQSESQVRLFVNTRDQRWAAWAFPQKANTGMTARELDVPEAALQRQQFNAADGWIYFGTVHHHCGGSAFQSGTDEANERNQDGVHITVGFMNRTWYDIHDRFYLKGMKLLAFDISDLWAVTTDYTSQWASIPEPLRPAIPADAKQKMARYEMGRPAPAGQTFPEQWRTNVIVEVQVVRTIAPSSHSTTHYTHPARKSWSERAEMDLLYDRNRALDQIKDYIDDLAEQTIAGSEDAYSLTQAVELISEMSQHFTEHDLNIIDILARNDVTPTNMESHIQTMMEKAKEKKELEDAKLLTPPGAQQQQRDPSEAEVDEFWEAMHANGRQSLD
jgi:hypothetical protein